MDSNIRHTFHKAERLCSRKTIEALFAGGHKSVSAYPIRVVMMPLEEGDVPFCDIAKLPPVQVLISVSKRRFKHAVDRNRVKRLIREAYRLNKYLLTPCLEAQGKHYALAFLWLSNEIMSYEVVEKKVVTLLNRVAEEVNSLAQ